MVIVYAYSFSNKLTHEQKKNKIIATIEVRSCWIRANQATGQAVQLQVVSLAHIYCHHLCCILAFIVIFLNNFKYHQAYKKYYTTRRLEKRHFLIALKYLLKTTALLDAYY